MVVVKLLQKGTETGMFGHTTRNAFALLFPICWLLNDETYRRVVTRNGPVHRVLADMEVAMEVACFSHRTIDKRSVNPGLRAYNPID